MKGWTLVWNGDGSHHFESSGQAPEAVVFSRDDVAKLRSLTLDGTWGPGKYWQSRGEDLPEAYAWLDDLANRIERIVSPE